MSDDITNPFQIENGLDPNYVDCVVGMKLIPLEHHSLKNVKAARHNQDFGPKTGTMPGSVGRSGMSPTTFHQQIPGKAPGPAAYTSPVRRNSSGQGKRTRPISRQATELRKSIADGLPFWAKIIRDNNIKAGS